MTTLLLEQRPDKDASNISFDDIMGEHTYKKTDFFTVMNYLIMIFTMVFHLGLLSSDIYTLLQIYALGNWGDYAAIKYVPIRVYKVVFTICIGISLAYLIWSVFLGFAVARRYMIVSSYLNQVSRTIHSLRSYERFCILDRISSKSFHEWTALTIYGSFHYDIYPWLFADTPRQLLNGVTIASTISNSFTSTNIITVLETIANTNQEEAILLSFMTFSFVVWLFFTFKHVMVLLISFAFISKNKKNHDMSFKDYCYMIVANSVMDMYEKEEKKTAKILKDRRKIPSFIGRHESIGSPQVELDPITEEKLPPDYSKRQGSNGSTANYGLQKQRNNPNPFNTPHTTANYPSPFADPFRARNGSNHSLDEVPPARVRTNTNPYIQLKDDIYRSRTNDSFANPFADRRLHSDSTNNSSLNDNPFANDAGVGYGHMQPQRTGHSHKEPPISNNRLYSRSDTQPTTIGPYTNRNDSVTSSTGLYNDRNDSVTSHPQIYNRNDSLSSNPHQIYERNDSLATSSTQLYSHVNGSVTSHQTHHQPYARNDSVTSNPRQAYSRNDSVNSNSPQLYNRNDSLPHNNGLYSSRNNSAASLVVQSNHLQNISESKEWTRPLPKQRKPPQPNSEISSNSENPLYGNKFF